MKFRKILVPTDFSPVGEPALEVATSLARDNDAKLVIMHVHEPPIEYGGGEMYYGVQETDRDELRKMLCEIAPTDQVVYSRKLVVGDPIEAIIQVAESEKVDLIVMGTHERRGLQRLLGSVSEAVVRRAKCPVLTVKQPAAVLAEAL